jgi:GDPmannose 4,6-dehydratase
MTDRRCALITGVAGQDGTYLAELLLAKGYEVHGIECPSCSSDTKHIDDLCIEPCKPGACFFLHYGDMIDATRLIQIMQEVQPNEVYNLAAQSHVKLSFDTPIYTGNVNGLGTLRLLEAIRILNMVERTRFYQASSSEMYGNAPTPQSENTSFMPLSPYAAAKLYAYWITKIYRDGYGIHASNGILFNHESPVRGEIFVTRKITRAVARIELGLQDRLWIGNLEAKRDWGHARDYVDGMWRILQQDGPDDYVLATGEAHSVREFVEQAFAQVGCEIIWQGKGVHEKGLERRTGRLLVEVDTRYFRPLEANYLLGDPSKARQILGWEHKVSFEELIVEMVADELKKLKLELEAS